LAGVQERFDKTLVERLEQVATTPFKRLSYTEGIVILQAEVAAGKATFEEPNIVWGMDLGSEHERYLAETVFKGPIILFNYPKEIKSFYMRLNDDGKTVAAMDVLVPKVSTCRRQPSFYLLLHW
jgi:asparaginyl-tRNA synthetase